MIPRLFPATAKDFSTLGIGGLSEAISCFVTEERNSTYELELTYPITGRLFEQLAEERIVYADPCENALHGQPFRIYRITRPISGIVTIYAEHISYQLNNIVIGPNIHGQGVADTLAIIKHYAVPENDFTFWTDKETDGNWGVDEPKTVMSCLKGEQGSILDIFGGGDYEFDGWDVKLHKNRGKDNGVVISYGKNLTDVEKESDISGVYTAMRPWWKNENEQYFSLPASDPLEYNPHYTDYVFPRVKIVDVSDLYEEGLNYDFMSAKARNYCRHYMNDNSTWQLPANIKVKMAPLWQTDEYKDNPIISNTVCNLCDIVTVRYEALGIETKTKIIKVVYDVLANRNSEIEVGEKRETLVGVIAEIARRQK